MARSSAAARSVAWWTRRSWTPPTTATTARPARRPAAGWAGRAAAARRSIPRATLATSKRTSSKVPNSMIPASFLGVVTSIVGARQFPHRLRGRAEPRRHHAHGGPPGCRHGAGAAGRAIDRRFPHVAGPRVGVDNRPHHRWTPARPASSPAAPRCCSSSATPTRRCCDRLAAGTGRAGGRGGERPLRCDGGRICHARCRRRWTRASRALLARAAEHYAPGRVVQMPSGAGHDAQILAKRLPAAMLFVPSIGGISHHWAEDTKEDDIVLGCAALADAAAQILGVA